MASLADDDYGWAKVTVVFGRKKLRYQQLIAMWIDGKRVPGPVYIAGWQYHYEYQADRWHVYPPGEFDD